MVGLVVVVVCGYVGLDFLLVEDVFGVRLLNVDFMVFGESVELNVCKVISVVCCIFRFWIVVCSRLVFSCS